MALDCMKQRKSRQLISGHNFVADLELSNSPTIAAERIRFEDSGPTMSNRPPDRDYFGLVVDAQVRCDNGGNEECSLAFPLSCDAIKAGPGKSIGG